MDLNGTPRAENPYFCGSSEKTNLRVAKPSCCVHLDLSNFQANECPIV
jgi:hypothetical protein